MNVDIPYNLALHGSWNEWCLVDGKGTAFGRDSWQNHGAISSKIVGQSNRSQVDTFRNWPCTNCRTCPLDVESCRSHVCLRLWQAGSRKGGGQSCHRWSIMNYPTHNASGDTWSMHWIDRSVSFGCLVFMEFALDRLVDCPFCLDIHHSQHPMTHEKRGPWPHCQAKILTWHFKVVKRCFLQFVGDAQVIAVPVSLGPATWGMMLCGQNQPSQVWEIKKQSKNIQKG